MKKKTVKQLESEIKYLKECNEHKNKTLEFIHNYWEKHYNNSSEVQQLKTIKIESFRQFCSLLEDDSLDIYQVTQGIDIIKPVIKKTWLHRHKYIEFKVEIGYKYKKFRITADDFDEWNTPYDKFTVDILVTEKLLPVSRVVKNPEYYMKQWI